MFLEVAAMVILVLAMVITIIMTIASTKMTVSGGLRMPVFDITVPKASVRTNGRSPKHPYPMPKRQKCIFIHYPKNIYYTGWLIKKCFAYAPKG